MVIYAEYRGDVEVGSEQLTIGNVSRFSRMA